MDQTTQLQLYARIVHYVCLRVVHQRTSFIVLTPPISTAYRPQADMCKEMCLIYAGCAGFNLHQMDEITLAFSASATYAAGSTTLVFTHSYDVSVVPSAMYYGTMVPSNGLVVPPNR